MADRLVTVASFDDSVRAALARNVLAEAGIDAVVTDEQTVGNYCSLSNAVGGIKVQVSLRDVERAEHILVERLAVAPTAITADSDAELEEERAAERDAENPANRIADRAFLAAIFGFLFFPLHFYVLWLLLSLRFVPERLNPNRRWKIVAACVLNLPVLFAVWLAVSPWVPTLNGWLYPDGLAWEEQSFESFSRPGEVSFPYPLGGKLHLERDEGVLPLPRADVVFVGLRTSVHGATFGVDLYHYPPLGRGQRAPDVYQEFLAAVCAATQGKVEQQSDTEVSGYPAVDATVVSPKARWRGHLLYARQQLYVVWVRSDQPERLHTYSADKFLKSLRLD